MNFTSTQNIHLLPLSQTIPPTTLMESFPEGDILACDFAVEGAIQHMTEQRWGYCLGRLSNIDHHADTPRMQRPISSANLALMWLEEEGTTPNSSHIVINHTDCDSVLSAALIAGHVEPLEQFGQAAVAADHTGAANPITDLLQSLDSHRDYDLSLRSLRLLLDGKALQSDAQVSLDERLRKREEAMSLVESGRFSNDGGVFYTCVERSLYGEFFPALLPQAQVIVLFAPHATPGRWIVKLRLGLKAPAGFSLHKLDIQSFDIGYGGRWNAGSNKRGGMGTALTPDQYAHQLSQALVDLKGG